jgi:hypothetical protein
MLRILIAIFFCWIPLHLIAGECWSTETEDFTAFFFRFANEKPFAVTRTIFPLKQVRWEDGIDAKGNDDSAPIYSSISKVEFSAEPSLSTYMKENGLVANIKQLATNDAVVEVFKPDTDWLTTYHFLLKDNCWFLHEYHDHSL